MNQFTESETSDIETFLTRKEAVSPPSIVCEDVANIETVFPVESTFLNVYKFVLLTALGK